MDGLMIAVHGEVSDTSRREYADYVTEPGAMNVEESPSAMTIDGTSDNTLNVLLMGQTGVGKSTFINALYNYLTFYSFDDVCAGELQTLIYSEFKLGKQKYTCGKPDNSEGAGNRKPGSSCTQRCKAYTFSLAGGNNKIRLIDTPGIADTNGFPRDEQNMKDILSYISQYKVLHAICILLKPNEERLTPVLRYCIGELLAHLHKDASRNIVFCFTNSRSTMFRDGGTLHLLEDMLKESPQTAAIKLDESTLYYFDSEAFRFLASLKGGAQYNSYEKDMFKSSWGQSTEEAGKLIEHIVSLEPHDVASTLSLNLAREMLAGIEEPLAQITQAVKSNLDEVSKTSEELTKLIDSRGTNAEIRKALIINEEVLETVPLGHSRTVCNSSVCKGRICHEPCSVTETFLGSITGDSDEEEDQIIFCKKFSLFSGCEVCGCLRSSHLRISKVMRTVVHEREDENIRKLIEQAEDTMQKKSKLLQIVNRRLQSYQDEMKTVLDAAALFAGFLEQNSIVVYHSATRAYLVSQIELMKKPGAQDTDESRRVIKELEAHLENFDKKVRNFASRNVRTSLKKITINEVNDELKKLYALSGSGAAILEVMRDIEQEYITSRVAGRRDELVCSIPMAVQGPAGAANAAAHRLIGIFEKAFRSRFVGIWSRAKS